VAENWRTRLHGMLRGGSGSTQPASRLNCALPQKSTAIAALALKKNAARVRGHGETVHHRGSLHRPQNFLIASTNFLCIAWSRLP